MKRVAMIGVGSISGIYLKNITERFPDIELAGVCDLIPERAEKARAEYGTRVYKDMFEAFDDPTVDIVLNITRPYQHYEVTRQALLHGKHVYSEKPLAADMDEARELLALAAEKRLRIGGAPDTFMGAGIQTCRKLLDDGFIGEVVGATAHMLGRGPESWHPDPEFFYKRAGGPMMDMGPYYMTTLVNLLGPVEAVSGMSRITFPQRVATCREHYMETIDVEISTHVNALLLFASGAIGNAIMSFDVQAAHHPCIEIYGSRGTMTVPDPNTFGGDVLIYRPEDGEWRHMPLLYGYKDNSRALGLNDMACALEQGRAARASSDLTFHVLNIMTGVEKSAQTREIVRMETRPDRPAPFAGQFV